MDKLEERLFDEFNNPTAYELKNKPGFEYEQYLARIAAKICLEHMNLAHFAGWRGALLVHTAVFQMPDGRINDNFDNLLKEVL